MEQEQTNQQLEVSSEEFHNWVENKITKHVVRELLGIREQAKEYLASGGSINVDAEGNAPTITTDRMVGRIEGLTELFNLFSEVKEDTKESPNYDH